MRRLVAAVLLLAGTAGIVASLLLPVLLDGGLTWVAIDRSVRPMGPSAMAAVRWALAGTGGLAVLAAGVLLRRPWPRFARVGQDLGSFRLDLGRDIAARWAVTTRQEGVVLAAALILGIGLRLESLRLPIGYDEAHNYVLFASRGVLDIVTDYTMPNNHILHTLLSWASLHTFGDSLLTLRLPAFAAGVLTIPVAWWAMSRVLGRAVALPMTAILAVAAPSVAYGAQARGYSLGALLFFGMILVASFLVTHRTWTGWVVLVGLMVASLYTVPTQIIGVGAVLLWLLISARRPTRGAIWTEVATGAGVVALATAILYLPPVLRGALPSIPEASLAHVPSGLAQTVSVASTCWTGGQPWFVVGLLAIGLMLTVFRPADDGDARRLLLAMAVTLVAVVGLQRSVPPARTIYFLMPVAVAAALGGLWGVVRHSPLQRRWKDIAWCSFAALLLLLPLRDHYARVRSSPVERGRASEACAGGFSGAAPALVDHWVEQGGPGVLVGHHFSGLETVRYYAMKAGVYPGRVVPYVPEDGLAQLEPYQRLYVITAASREATVLRSLSIDPADYEDRFLAPVLEWESPGLWLWLVRPKAPPQEPADMGTLSRNIRYAW